VEKKEADGGPNDGQQNGPERLNPGHAQGAPEDETAQRHGPQLAADRRYHPVRQERRSNTEHKPGVDEAARAGPAVDERAHPERHEVEQRRKHEERAEDDPKQQGQRGHAKYLSNARKIDSLPSLLRLRL